MRSSEANPFLLHIKVVDNNANEEVQGKEGAEDDEEDEVQVHEVARILLRLLTNLDISNNLHEVNIGVKNYNKRSTFFTLIAVVACRIKNIVQILQKVVAKSYIC